MNIKYKGYLNIIEDEHPSNEGMVIKREVMSKESETTTDECVAGLLYDPDKKIVYLANQYRPANKNNMVEVVAGTMEKNEIPEKCFTREAMEEVGFNVLHTKKLDSFYTSPGIAKEKVHLFIGIGSRTENGGGLDEEHEEIDVVPMPIYEFINYKFEDLKSELIKNIFKYEYIER